MIRLIFSIVFFVLLAIFVAINARFITSINVFGYQMEEVATVAVLIIAMALGVIYSFTLYLISYFTKSRARRLKTQKGETKSKERELKKREKTIGETEEAIEQNVPAQMTSEQEEQEKIERPVMDLLRPKKKKKQKKDAGI